MIAGTRVQRKRYKLKNQPLIHHLIQTSPMCSCIPMSTQHTNLLHALLCKSVVSMEAKCILLSTTCYYFRYWQHLDCPDLYSCIILCPVLSYVQCAVDVPRFKSDARDQISRALVKLNGLGLSDGCKINQRGIGHNVKHDEQPFVSQQGCRRDRRW